MLEKRIACGAIQQELLVNLMIISVRLHQGFGGYKWWASIN